MYTSKKRRQNSPDRLTVSVIIFGIITVCIIGFVFISHLFEPDLNSETASFDIYEVSAPCPKDPGTIPIPNSLKICQVVELRQMLENRQFARLNSVLDEYQKRFEKDQADEYKLYDAYQVFGCALASYEKLIKNWITATPGHYQPYLAMARYYSEKGWRSRGAKWAKETSREQFDGMRLFFEKSKANLKTAFKKKPDSPVAYDILMGMYTAAPARSADNPWVDIVFTIFPNSPEIRNFIYTILVKIFKQDLLGKNSAMEKLIDETSRLFPQSFILKSSVLWSKEPRWGGSYKQMEKFAKKAQRTADKNPKLSTLYGMIYYDQARRFRARGDYGTALNLLEKALKFGDHWAFYDERAEIYLYDLKIFDNALKAANKSAELRPPIYRTRLGLSKIHYARGDYPLSIDDLQTAEQLSPANPEILSWKAWASKQMMNKGHQLFKSDLHGAIEQYNVCLEFNSHNFQAFYWRGQAFSKLKKFKEAVSDYQTAIHVNPRHFESYRAIDYLYAQNHRWGDIINYWNRFIELEPNHADAYFERSGAYYHNNDMVNAKRDLKKACDLGNEDACRQYTRVQNSD